MRKTFVFIGTLSLISWLLSTLIDIYALIKLEYNYKTVTPVFLAINKVTTTFEKKWYNITDPEIDSTFEYKYSFTLDTTSIILNSQQEIIRRNPSYFSEIGGLSPFQFVPGYFTGTEELYINPKKFKETVVKYSPSNPEINALNPIRKIKGMLPRTLTLLILSICAVFGVYIEFKNN